MFFHLTALIRCTIYSEMGHSAPELRVSLLSVHLHTEVRPSKAPNLTNNTNVRPSDESAARSLCSKKKKNQRFRLKLGQFLQLTLVSVFLALANSRVRARTLKAPRTRPSFIRPNAARSGAWALGAQRQIMQPVCVLMCGATVCVSVCGLCQHLLVCRECLLRYAAARVVIYSRKPTFTNPVNRQAEAELRGCTWELSPHLLPAQKP